MTPITTYSITPLSDLRCYEKANFTDLCTVHSNSEEPITYEYQCILLTKYGESKCMVYMTGLRDRYVVTKCELVGRLKDPIGERQVLVRPDVIFTIRATNTQHIFSQCESIGPDQPVYGKQWIKDAEIFEILSPIACRIGASKVWSAFIHLYNAAPIEREPVTHEAILRWLKASEDAVDKLKADQGSHLDTQEFNDLQYVFDYLILAMVSDIKAEDVKNEAQNYYCLGKRLKGVKTCYALSGKLEEFEQMEVKFDSDSILTMCQHGDFGPEIANTPLLPLNPQWKTGS